MKKGFDGREVGSQTTNIRERNDFTNVLLDEEVVFTGFSNTCQKPHKFHLHIFGEDKQKIKSVEYYEEQKIAVDCKDLFIGGTYVVKLEILHLENSEVFKTYEKKFTIGGKRVARDVKVKLGQIKHRWVDVSFRPPEYPAGLLYYRVCASAPGAPTRVQKTKSSATTMKYLKSLTTYNITVTSVYDENEECRASTTFAVTTEGSRQGTHGVHVFGLHAKGASVSLQDTTINQTTITPTSPVAQDFGMVRNLQEYFQPGEGNYALMCLRWNQPMFSDRYYDFFIDYFQVEVFEEGGGCLGDPIKVAFNPEDHLTEYKCDPIQVIAAKSYTVRVKTYYEDVETGLGNVSREETKTVKSGLEINAETEPPVSDVDLGHTVRFSNLLHQMGTLSHVTDVEAPSTPQVPQPTLVSQQTQPKEAIQGANEIANSNRKKEYQIKRGTFANFYIVSSDSVSKAVKMEITLDYADPAVIRELADRMRTVLSLNHERLLNYLEYIPKPPNYSIIMEYLDWQKMNMYIKDSSITEEDASTYALQIIEGIEYLHQNDLIHGNLNCSNIWLKAFQGIKIGGFAVGRALKEKLSKISRSDDGKFIQWSPEETDTVGSFTMNKSVDVWAIGCTVYEIITGKPPLHDKRWRDRKRATAGLDIPPITWASDKLKEFLDKTINFKDQRLSTSELKRLPWLQSTTNTEGNPRGEPSTSPIDYDEAPEDNEYLNDVKIVKKIGHGAYGSIFKAITRDGKPFAMKEVEVEKDEREKGMREYYFAEKRKIHKNIIQFYGCENSKLGSKVTYRLAMELMKKSIRDELRDDGKFNEMKTKNYANQIMDGLVYLHRDEFIHRDIRGANILIGFDGVLKIADFGFIRKILPEQDRNLTRDGRGTARWMSPEAVLGEKPVTVKTDVWSLGCTIIEMLTTKPPLDEVWPEVKVKEMILDNKVIKYIPTGASQPLKKLLRDVFKMDTKDRPHVYLLLTEYKWLGTNI